MKTGQPILGLAVLGLIAGQAMPALPAFAGGGPGDVNSLEEKGTHFFGEVKDIAGFKPLEGARVKIAITGTRMFLVVLTDDEGRFRLEGFGKDVDAGKVAVTCSKDGYRAVEALSRHTSSDRHAPIEVECLMALGK